MIRVVARAAASLVVLLAVERAHAQSPAEKAANALEAQRLFNEALTAMKAESYGEACPKLERSQELDPGMGTQFRLAECYEKSGHLVQAAALYQEVVDAAKAAGRADRAAQARSALDVVLPRVPVLFIELDADTSKLPGLEVSIDGRPVDAKRFGQRMPVDVGPRVVSVRASRRVPYEKKVTVVERDSLHLKVPPLDVDASAPPEPTSKQAGRDEGAGAGDVALPLGFAIGLGAAGVVGLGVGIGTGVVAMEQWSDADANCLPKSGDAPRVCNPTGIDAHDSASTMATVSTIGFVAGGVLVAAAVPPLVIAILDMNASPSGSAATLDVVPVLGPGSAGVLAQGRF